MALKKANGLSYIALAVSVFSLFVYFTRPVGTANFLPATMFIIYLVLLTSLIISKLTEKK